MTKRIGSARWRWLLVTLVAAVLTPGQSAAQVMDGSGLVATGLLLRQMDGVKRVLMIGAHPDDEDTSLLTALARGAGAETAYLSLTRGDGGQNLLGPELWEGLGIIRTGELEAARRLDGGRQFFARAFDYGFSKSADEAFSLWPREELLHDVVWVVRTFRPHVVVSVFSGTPRDGHGQHQAAGIVAREAFAVAGDPTRFPEQLERGVEAWAPSVLYQSSRRFFGRGGGPAAEALTLETGVFDPLLGRSHFQLSMESRSQHRSQDMGASRPPGPRRTGVILVESRVGTGGDPGLFAGVDTTLIGLTDALPAEAATATAAHLEAYRSALAWARERFGLDATATAASLADALRHLHMARDAAGLAAGTELRYALGQKIALANRAYLSASSVVLDVRAQDDLVVPGQTVQVRAQLWNGGQETARGVRVALETLPSWTVREVGREGMSTTGDVEPGALATWSYEVAVDADADLSRLYFLERERDGARYRWPEDHTLWGLPRDPAPVRAAFAWAATGSGDVAIESSVEWRFVGVDPARGEFEEPVLVVPTMSVRVAPGGMVWPSARTAPRSVTVAVRSEARGARRGEVRLEVPVGWSVSPEAHIFELSGEGSERTVSFEVAPSGSPRVGEHTFRALLRTEDGATYDEAVALIDYDHIERAAMFTPAETRVTVLPVRVAEGLRVGYIMGSGDDGPGAIAQLGADVELVGEEAVRNGAYDRYHVVVLGIRAYETRADLQAASAQLLDFARAGGTVVVQYNRGSLGSLAPYEMRVGRGSPRVADETAAVRLLDARAPVFTTPNRITDEDFEGWVQERGLYFAAEWDDAYTPLLELADPGEEPRRGSLLVAPLGDGVFVYTALSFFRQWSARVPGAYRLFANLVSLDASEWSTFSAGAGPAR